MDEKFKPGRKFTREEFDSISKKDKPAYLADMGVVADFHNAEFEHSTKYDLAVQQAWIVALNSFNEIIGRKDLTDEELKLENLPNFLQANLQTMQERQSTDLESNSQALDQLISKTLAQLAKSGGRMEHTRFLFSGNTSTIQDFLSAYAKLRGIAVEYRNTRGPRSQRHGYEESILTLANPDNKTKALIRFIYNREEPSYEGHNIGVIFSIEDTE